MALTDRQGNGVPVGVSRAAVCVVDGVDPTEAVTVPLRDLVPEGVNVEEDVPVLSAVDVAVAVNVDVRVLVIVSVLEGVLLPVCVFVSVIEGVAVLECVLLAVLEGDKDAV